MFDTDASEDGKGKHYSSEDIPPVESTDDFELCRAVKDRGKSSEKSTYEVLDSACLIRGLLNNWEELYVQFRDQDGNLLPVQVSELSLLEEEEEEQARVRAPLPSMPVRKGKRKAPPE
ncbi:hypothetical protein ID866_4229 [Astraeus odoratus]|nr:hypothetical protein ID866_4229 [Astraeus odoratus]